MHTAALPRTREDARDRVRQPLVVIADGQAHAVQTAGPQRAQELRPERLGLDLAEVQADHLAPPAVMDRVGDHQRLADHAAGVPARAVWQSDEEGTVALSVAVCREPIVGLRSGETFPLTHERFALLMEAVRAAAERIHKPEVLAEELQMFPGGLRNERALILLFEP
jgi:hypothetical protein